MKKPVIKNQPVSTLVIAQAILTLDSQGIYDDHTFLIGAKWEVMEDDEDHVLYHKPGGVLRLRGSQDEDNEHRINGSYPSTRTRRKWATLRLRCALET
jgi:hypothetical protein